jgi:peptidyl-tRNA hydrolase, PTH1 family
MPSDYQSPYLIVGLGNPGREYRLNRHNVGFRVLDSLAEKLGVTFSRYEMKGLVTKCDYKGRRLVLAKPQTYMNLSGETVSGLTRFYKVPLCQLLIVYDDVDIPLGTLRLRPDGGSGGHKGISSIIDRLGTQEFPRLRVGISRPPGRKDAADYVLQDFSTAEAETLARTLERSVEAIQEFISKDLDQAMNLFNGTGE